MEKQIQLFQVADLIFSYSENEELSLTQKEINEIEARFKNIVKSFEKFENTDFAGGIKHKEMPLPYNSAIHIRRERKRLVLHFTCNFGKPLFLLIDTKENKAKNFLDINLVKQILRDDIFNAISLELSYPKTELNNILNLDIDKTTKAYQEKLKLYENSNKPAGRECVEFELNKLLADQNTCAEECIIPSADKDEPAHEY